jgi:hypothetical protein
MIHACPTLYDRTTHPISNSQSGNYRLAKIALLRHTFLYNDDAQIVLVADILNDQVFYIRGAFSWVTGFCTVVFTKASGSVFSFSRWAR